MSNTITTPPRPCLVTLEAGLAALGLKLGEFDVLSTLRRAGQPHELTPGDMIRKLLGA